MMMTSGQAVKYKRSIGCAMQIMKNEGFMSMMKGAGAIILRGVAGAGVLAGFDQFNESEENELKVVSRSERSHRSTIINRIN